MKVRLPVGLKLVLAFGITGIFVLVWSLSVHRIYLKLRANDLCITTGLVPLQTGIAELKYDLLEAKMFLAEKGTEYSPESQLQALTRQNAESMHLVLLRMKLAAEASGGGIRESFDSVHHFLQDSVIGEDAFAAGGMKMAERYDEALRKLSRFSAVPEGKYHQLIDEQVFLYKKVSRTNQFFLLMLLLLLSGAGIFLMVSFVRPLRVVTGVLEEMGKGVIPDARLPQRGDEIGVMAGAVQKLIGVMRNITRFSLEVGKGNFTISYEPLSENDMLGNALISMRDELKQAAEEEAKRKKEDEQRNWAARGLALFGDILRRNSNDLQNLARQVISHLVRYVGANQGALFTVEEDSGGEQYLVIRGAYAYGRDKMLEKHFAPGEGLVGRCAMEKETIYLTEIPEDYVQITSGTGQALPRVLLLVPVITGDVVYGVIELASFRLLEPHEREFIEDVAESTAVTIAQVRANMQTAHLLEQSRQQAEEMAAQEEEMRQNMEELRATQEQYERRENELLQQVYTLRKRLKGEE